MDPLLIIGAAVIALIIGFWLGQQSDKVSHEDVLIAQEREKKARQEMLEAAERERDALNSLNAVDSALSGEWSMADRNVAAIRNAQFRQRAAQRVANLRSKLS